MQYPTSYISICIKIIKLACLYQSSIFTIGGKQHIRSTDQILAWDKTQREGDDLLMILFISLRFLAGMDGCLAWPPQPDDVSDAKLLTDRVLGDKKAPRKASSALLDMQY